MVQQRHGHDQNDEICQHIEGGDDGRSDGCVDAPVRFIHGPVRIDGHALEDCGENLSDAIGGYEKENAP